jgi:neutral ceramidase
MTQDVLGRNTPNQVYEVGVGIADVTGPSAEIGMMGYANPSQSARGIHTRLFSRAFIVKEGENRVVFVSADIAMIDQATKFEVVRILEQKFGDKYNSKNVLLSGTHTHSGIAGYIQYAMYGITSLGFNQANFRSIVDGIVQSIERADASMQRGRIFLNRGELQDANINRSPVAYDNNPAAERARYTDNVDKEMTLLRFENEAGDPLGSLNWFAVHPVSMNNTNRLISGDNKGYASMLFEYEMNPNDRPGRGKFVAAFASSNLGDVSPNIRGPKCINTGEDCDALTSTCGGFVQNCIAFGPGNFGNMEESTEIIGRRQFDKAFELFNDAAGNSIELSGTIQHAHQYVDMTNYPVKFTNSTGEYDVTTCKGAMGYSFAAGTTDGPGAFDFKQGETSNNAFWDFIRDFLHPPTPGQISCHAPKPILLDVGEVNLPYAWVPAIVETQLLRVGNLFIVGIPGELTTMSGRRLREAIAKRAGELGVPDPQVVIAGLSNVYTHYIATYEEYQIQRYEGASTIYGPHTLGAYMKQYPFLLEEMIAQREILTGPPPPNLLDKQFSLISPIVLDMPPVGYKFGDVKLQPYPMAYPGETIVTRFVSGHPRNSPMREGTFILVERRDDDNGNKWHIVATDADWSTKFTWRRPVIVSADSEVEISWKTSADTQPGTYRIRHFGHFKPAFKDSRPYQGSTQWFEIRPLSMVSNSRREPNPEIKRRTFLMDFWKKLTSFRLTRSSEE